jgi:hypothetical protein
VSPLSQPRRDVTIALAALALAATVPTADAAPSVVLQTLFRFDTAPATGRPVGTQIAIDGAGNVYGTTARLLGNAPTLYRLTPPPPRAPPIWTMTTLHKFEKESAVEDPTFPSNADCRPVTGAFLDRAGNILGMTHCTKQQDSKTKYFKFTPGQVYETVLIQPDYHTNLIPKGSEVPAGWKMWRGYGYALAMTTPGLFISPLACPDNATSNLDRQCRDGLLDFPVDPSQGPDLGYWYYNKTRGAGPEHGFMPGYVTTDPTGTIYGTMWATSTGDQTDEFIAYASQGLLYRAGPDHGMGGGDPDKLFGKLERLAVFKGPLGHPNGVTPDGFGGLFVTTSGNAYVTGAVVKNYGAVYHWTHAQGLELLHAFTKAEGGAPMPAGVMKGAIFWGITSGVDAAHPAAVFEIDTTFNFVVAHRLAGGAEGSLAASQLVAAPDGYVYGTTLDAASAPSRERTFAGGSVFRFHP